ncbi:unnamed protein product [Caenorhabditis angaria]|uniref:Uncharacterized protein n=1 Tax=Caenorhabditis angaria TaxID=860376 RepID=A0A9P1N4D7_9PELO|nr:unnamed protein product [Caenorhabditis angaria]
MEQFIKLFTSSKNKNTEEKQAAEDLEERRIAAERAERRRQFDEEMLRNEKEREQRARENEERRKINQMAAKEREESMRRKMAEIERQNELRQSEIQREQEHRFREMEYCAAKELERKEQIHAQIMHENQAKFDSMMVREQEETQSIINEIQDESKKNSEESELRRQKINDEMLEFNRLAEENRQRKEKELEELCEKTRIELENSRKMWEERKRQLDDQMKFMQEMMRKKLWTMKLESYFTNRLNFLRTSNREISRNHLLLEDILRIANRRKEEKNEIPEEVINSKMEILRKSVDSEKELMKNESESYLEILEKGQWLFLNSVRTSCDDVFDSCIRFENTISQIDISNIPNYISLLRKANDDVCSKIRVIPTFGQLKQMYQNFDYNQTQTNYGMIEEAPSSVIIEEID